MKKKACLLLTVLLFLGACSSEPTPTPPAAGEKEAKNPDPGVSKETVGEPETKTPSEKTEPKPVAKTPEPWEALTPEERVLQAYQAIVCHMQKADQQAVQAVWIQFGYNDTSWAQDVQKAIQQASADPKGFGKKWRLAKRTRCP